MKLRVRMRAVLAKRCAALALALLLSVCAALPAHGAEPGFINFQNQVKTYTAGMFPDVPEAWYTTYVAAVYELGLMQGDADGRFRPDGSVTLAETAALAARLHQTYFSGSSEFAQGEPWYGVYVDYCVENGIIPTAFTDPNAAARRSEYAAMLARALPESALQQINEIPDGQIPDVPADGSDAAGIYRLYRAGVLTGNDEYGTFLPGSEIKRSEVAAIVSRMAYRSLRKVVELKPKPLYPDLLEGERKDDDFFSDAAMLGNSLVQGMEMCAGLKLAYYGQQSANVLNYGVDKVLYRQFGKLYIELGINDFGLSRESFISGYRKILDKLRAAMPDAEIYIMAITPVTKARSDEGTFTMQKIRDMNEALHALAEETQCWYLDCCTPLCDGTGYLPAKYGGWDGSPHLSNEGYQAWAEVIRTHYAQ